MFAEQLSVFPIGYLLGFRPCQIGTNLSITIAVTFCRLGVGPVKPLQKPLTCVSNCNKESVLYLVKENQ